MLRLGRIFILVLIVGATLGAADARAGLNSCISRLTGYLLGYDSDFRQFGGKEAISEYLAKIGYAPEVANQLILKRPALVHRILGMRSGGEPITIYRGISIKDRSLLSLTHRGNLSPDRVYIARTEPEALGWGIERQKKFGGKVFLIKAQVPQFLIRNNSNFGTEYLKLSDVENIEPFTLSLGEYKGTQENWPSEIKTHLYWEKYTPKQ